MSNQTTFLFLALGDKFTYHLQTIFSLLSIAKFQRTNSQFLIYTDQPEQYKWLADTAIIHTIDQQVAQEWMGSSAYFYRIKIMAMLDAAQKYDGHLIFLDADTFVMQDLTPLTEQLTLGFSFLHIQEKLISDPKGTNDHKRMWKAISGKTINDIKMDESIRMWNSGIIALNTNDKLVLLEQVRSFNDRLCEMQVASRVKEQFAFSVILEKQSQLKIANNWILHYWGNKEEWHQKILDFLMPQLLAGKNPLEVAKSINPADWKKIPYHRHVSSLKKSVLAYYNPKKDRILTVE